MRLVGRVHRADEPPELLDGRIRQIGDPTEVFANPVDDEVASFLGVTGFPGVAGMSERV